MRGLLDTSVFIAAESRRPLDGEAASRGLVVVTQDDDFGPVEGVGGLRVVRV